MMTRGARIAAIVMALAVAGPFSLPGERKLLAEGNPKEPETEDVRLLKLAFGPECNELRRRCRVYLPSFGMILATDRAELRKDGRAEYRNVSIVRFRMRDGKEVVVETVRDSTIIGPNVLERIVGDSIAFECESGMQLRIERIR
jgi:hypothetical protein